LTRSSIAVEDPIPMADGTARNRRRIWLVVVGAAVGLALGILVSVTTDVPFAPEVGLLLGGLGRLVLPGRNTSLIELLP
jgi:uncharacterized protein involved in exopolysaccharide biosynthesis